MHLKRKGGVLVLTAEEQTVFVSLRFHGVVDAKSVIVGGKEIIVDPWFEIVEENGEDVIYTELKPCEGEQTEPAWPYIVFD